MFSAYAHARQSKKFIVLISLCRAGMVEARDLPAGLRIFVVMLCEVLGVDKRREGTEYGTVPALQLV